MNTMIINYGNTYPKPRFVHGEWLIPYAITTSFDEDGNTMYVAQEAASKTLFAHDINAVIPAGNDADVLEAIKHGIRLQRSKQYPPVTEYLDAIVKDSPSKVAAYRAACIAVKENNPFPTS